jgi:uncharacterized cupin superfamily protein
MNRTLLVAAATAALIGCQKAADQSDQAPSNTAATPAAPAPAAMVTANGSMPGTYEVTMKDGTKAQSTLRADGTFVDTDANGKQTDTGTWNVTNGKTCFKPQGKAETCYKETAVAADGSFTATPDKGDPVTVKKIG